MLWSVVLNGKNIQFMSLFYCFYANKRNDIEFLECTTGEVRLVNDQETYEGCPLNGSQPIKEGRVEVCQNGTYYTVCDDFWDTLEARVVCNQLNFSSELGIL